MWAFPPIFLPNISDQHLQQKKDRCVCVFAVDYSSPTTWTTARLGPTCPHLSSTTLEAVILATALASYLFGHLDVHWILSLWDNVLCAQRIRGQPKVIALWPLLEKKPPNDICRAPVKPPSEQHWPRQIKPFSEHESPLDLLVETVRSAPLAAAQRYTSCYKTPGALPSCQALVLRTSEQDKQ